MLCRCNEPLRYGESCPEHPGIWAAGRYMPGFTVCKDPSCRLAVRIESVYCGSHGPKMPKRAAPEIRVEVEMAREDGRYLPTWDEPPRGMDVGSLASHFMQRFARERWAATDPESEAMYRTLVDLMERALEYGAQQVRDRFLSPRLRTVVLEGRGVGQFWECRFCRATVSAAGGPDEMTHRAGCHLLVGPRELDEIETWKSVGESVRIK